MLPKVASGQLSKTLHTIENGFPRFRWAVEDSVVGCPRLDTAALMKIFGGGREFPGIGNCGELGKLKEDTTLPLGCNMDFLLFVVGRSQTALSWEDGEAVAASFAATTVAVSVAAPLWRAYQPAKAAAIVVAPASSM